MVRIIPVKGRGFVVNLDHVLTLDMVHPYKRQRIDVSVRDWLQWPKTKKMYSKLVRSDAHFEVSMTPLLVDPRLLGLLLGDGSFLGTPNLTNTHPRVLWYARQQAERMGLFFTPTRTDGSSSTSWRFSAGRWTRNPLRKALSTLGLMGVNSGNKFVPKQYKTASRQVRLEVLAGLMDTDGSVSCGGFDYTSKSQQLAEDVCFLARSVGLAAYMRPCAKSCQTGASGQYYRVFVSGDCSIIPSLFRRAKKRRQIKDVLHTGFRVEVIGEEDFYGFTLDGDGRYLMDDFTLTHNTGKTTLIRVVAEEFKCMILTPTGKSALRVREATDHEAMTIHRLLYKAERDEETGLTKFTPRSPMELMEYSGCLVVVDEASMIPHDVYLHLKHTVEFIGAKLLLVGDTFQLPPVQREDTTPFSALEVETSYRYALTEIVRQALDNPIVKASMLIRQGCEDYETLTLLNAIDPTGLDEHIIGLRERGGVALCYTNAKRHELNAAVRKTLGYAPETLESGEPILVLKNNYSVDRYNGEVLQFLAWQTGLSQVPVTDGWTHNSLFMDFGHALIEGEQRVLLSPQQMAGKAEKAEVGEIAIMKAARRFSLDNRDYGDNSDPPPFLFCTHGYTLTVHKSQGSEWPEVSLFIEPGIARRRDKFKARFLYTAITRGKTRVNYTYL
jgi:hypothetical protein